MNYIKLLLPAAALMLSACSATLSPTYEPIKPVPFEDSNSTALNIANQTDLTKDYLISFRSFSSPLRDFTQEDITEMNTKLTRPSGGSASKWIGSIQLLTGNLAGLGALSGGLAADLSSTKHPAATGRWIIALPAADYPNEITARKAMFNAITNAVVETANSYGFKAGVYDYKRWAAYNITIGGEEFHLGLDFSKTILEEKNEYGILKRQTVNFNGKDQDSYVFGVARGVDWGFLVHGVAMDAFKSKGGMAVDGFTYDEFLAKVTTRLGENYSYYQPNFTRYRKDGKLWVMLDDIVPKIYTNGNRYDFVKPE